MSTGIVAIVGRPNVGKSTLFNRLTASRKAIVDDQPGITRDRIYGVTGLDPDGLHSVYIVDTGGFETTDFNFQPFADNIVWQQTEFAIKEADLVIFLLDGKAGLQKHDRELYQYLTRTKKPLLIVVNKIDGLEHQKLLWDFYALGIEDPIAISASHSRGIGTLKAALLAELEKNDIKTEAIVSQSDKQIKVALIGRPNVGKSSLLNRITHSERAIVSEIAGTTRDAIDASIFYFGKEFIFIDTAGIRRKSRIDDNVESYSVIRSLNSIEQADIVVCVISALDGLTDQDLRLINLATKRYKPVIIAINKWDLVPEKTSNTSKQYDLNLAAQLGDLNYLPTIYLSCLTNQRVSKLLELSQNIYAKTQQRVPTARVNEALQKIVHEHTPQLIKKYSKRVKFYFATQVSVAPPTFVIKSNVSEDIQDSYKRYMMRKFSTLLDFEQIPIRFFFRDKTQNKNRGVVDDDNSFENSQDEAQELSQ
jgi:GTP-binding protein